MIKNQFGRRLTDTRKQAKLTQKQVAEKVNELATTENIPLRPLTRSTYAAYEEERSEPSLTMLTILKRIFNLQTVDELLC